MTTVEAQMSEVRATIAEMKKVNPKLRFTHAWEHLRKKRPELFSESPARLSSGPSGIIHAEHDSEVKVVQGGFAIDIFSGEVVSCSAV